MKRSIISGLLTSAGLTAATISGAIHDPTGTPVPDAKVFVYNPDTGFTQETTTSSDGSFSLGGASAGQYILRVEKAGFTSIFREFDLQAESKMNRQFTMTNGGDQSVINDSDATSEQPERHVRVGGGVAQSNLITKVNPTYPATAKAARIQGTVEIETTISADGVPVQLKVISSPSDDLSESSLEAVRKWRYRPTLLNGKPVGIVTDVIVNYTLVN